jgi:translation initiation factor IF-2
VDGSVGALSDSFSKLSTEEIQINIIHKGVGAITETLCWLLLLMRSLSLDLTFVLQEMLTIG